MEHPPPEIVRETEPPPWIGRPRSEWVPTASADELIAFRRQHRGERSDDYLARHAGNWTLQLCYDLLDHGPFRRGRYVAESVRTHGDLGHLAEAALLHAEEWMAAGSECYMHNPGAYLRALSFIPSALDDGHAHRLANLAIGGSVSSMLILSGLPMEVGGLLQWIVQVVDRAGWAPRRCEAVLWDLGRFPYYSGVRATTARGLMVRTAAASNRTPARVLRDIARRHTDRWTREALAGNAKALRDPAVRGALGSSRSLAVRRALEAWRG